MIVSGDVMNLSNVYRATDAGAPRADRSAFLIQTWETAMLLRSDHIFVACGDFPIDDAWANPIYLATIRSDGGYRIERAEPYLEPWKRPGFSCSERALNTRHLPDAVNNMAFYKALEYPRPSEQFWFNQWREGIISAYGCGVLYAPFPKTYPKDCLRIDFADDALVCDGRPIRRLELAKCTENGNNGGALALARWLLEKPHNLSGKRLDKWFAEHEGGRDMQERLLLYEQEPEPEKDWGCLIDRPAANER